jgi:hypothetical protein
MGDYQWRKIVGDGCGNVTAGGFVGVTGCVLRDAAFGGPSLWLRAFLAHKAKSLALCKTLVTLRMRAEGRFAGRFACKVYSASTAQDFGEAQPRSLILRSRRRRRLEGRTHLLPTLRLARKIGGVVK